VKNKLNDHVSNYSFLTNMSNIVSHFAAKNIFQEHQTEVFHVNSQEQNFKFNYWLEQTTNESYLEFHISSKAVAK
jgi:hypothetical protein